MKAAQLTQFGSPPTVQEVPEPVVGPDDVLVHVRAAAIHPIVKALASGTHYASPKQLPVGCGLDGVGVLDNGQRVYFGPVRAPQGALSQRVAMPKSNCLPIPDGVDDVTVAALINPGIAAWLPLAWRAKLAPKENVCILGATGTAGKLAVQAAKLQGAGRIVAVGRNAAVLAQLKEWGATSVIPLNDDWDAVAQAMAREAGPTGFDVIIDYLWGKPAETLLGVIARGKFATEMRWVEVGESAGPTVTVPASVLRSTGLAFYGFGLRTYGIAPREVLAPAFTQLVTHAARKALRIDCSEGTLDDIAGAWASATPNARCVVRV